MDPSRKSALPLIAAQHAEIDKTAKASGLTYNLLQPHFSMQNTMMSAQTVTSDGAVYIPFNEGMIDLHDIVDVAVKVLTEDEHQW